MATSDLQNSYGPEMAVRGHDLPQAVVGDGLEPTHPGQQYPSTAAPLAPPYSEQYAKNNQYNSPQSDPTQPNQTGGKRRVLGLPVALFWGIIIGLVVILALGLGVGLGVGLSQRDSSGGSASATAATSSANAGAETTSAPTSTTASRTTATSSTTSSTSAAATARNVEICNQASLATDCTNLTVPVNTCVDFPSAYNDSVSSVDTGGPDCAFYTGETCSGESWTTSGTKYVIPGEYNDAFSSVACFV